MRIWSIHPKYLDSKGLVALWREALLAKNVLRGETKGYKNHSQLTRFRALEDPINAINVYLSEVWKEAQSRGYNFNKGKIDCNFTIKLVPVNEGQIKYEAQHLLNKLEIRDQLRFEELKKKQNIEVHPIFKIVPGGIEEWEKVVNIFKKK